MDQTAQTELTEKVIADSLKDQLTVSVKRERALKAKIKDKREYIKERLQGIVPYLEADKKVKEATRERNKEKNQYMARPDMAKAEAELKEMSRELKEVRETQSEYASEYYRITQLNLFEMPDGSQAEIIPTMKLRVRMPKIGFGKSKYVVFTK